jgi:hypothetical protein
MGSLNYSGVYPINPAFPINALPAPGGVLRFPPQTVEEMQQPDGGSVPGPGAGAIGALLGALAAFGAAHVLQQHFTGSNVDATPKPIDPDFRALTRRPSAINGDQPPTADSAEVRAQPTAPDVAGGVPDGLAAKAHDPSNPKVINILGAPPIASEDSPVAHPDDDDDDCMRQRNKERKACFNRAKRNPEWDYLNECLDRATVRWDLCNRGIDPGDLKPWGRRNER